MARAPTITPVLSTPGSARPMSRAAPRRVLPCRERARSVTRSRAFSWLDRAIGRQCHGALPGTLVPMVTPSSDGLLGPSLKEDS